MRLVRPFHRACERVREHISLGLDCELSQLEQTSLDGHLERCATCRAFSAEVGALTAVLRSAPLQEPQFAIDFPRRSRLPLRVLQIGAAAAVAVSAGLAGLNFTHGEAQRSATPVLGSGELIVNDALEVDRIRVPGQSSNGFRGRLAR